MDLSRDNQFIVTLGADLDQSMHLWDWTNEKEEGPICSGQFLRTDTMKHQYWIKFNPDRNDEMVIKGPRVFPLLVTWQALLRHLRSRY